MVTLSLLSLREYSSSSSRITPAGTLRLAYPIPIDQLRRGGDGEGALAVGAEALVLAFLAHDGERIDGVAGADEAGLAADAAQAARLAGDPEVLGLAELGGVGVVGQVAADRLDVLLDSHD